METEIRAETRRPWALVAGVVFVALALVTHAAYASYTVGDAKQHATHTGTISLTLGGNDPEDDEFSIDASDIVAGDQVFRSVTLNIGGTIPLSDVTLTTDATTSSLLDTDTSRGLYLVLFTCSTPITQHAVGGVPVPDGCDGALQNPVMQPVVMSNVSIGSALDLTPGAHNYVGVFLILAGSNGDDSNLEGLHSVIRFRFAGVQRAGEYK